MKGTIVERHGSYQLRISLGKNPQTGKYDRYIETFHGKSTDAQKRLRELLTQLDKGTFVKPGKLTIKDFLNSWLTDYVRPNESTRTLELYSYMSDKHIIPTIGNILLSELKTQHLQHLYSEKLEHGRLDDKGGLSPRSVQLIHVTIHKALEYAISPGMNLIPWNIASAVTSPRVPHREMKTLSEPDVNSYLRSVKDTEYYALFYTYLHTAMRRCELLALQWLNVNLDPISSTISVTRSMEYINDKKIPPQDRIKYGPTKTTGSRRLINLTPSNAIVLREYRKAQNLLRQSLGLPAITDNDLVFSHIDGSPYLPQTITHAWMKAVRRAGFKGIRLHDARHTHASIMMRKGVHPKVVQERLGHSSIRTTLDLYSHVAPGMQEAAAAKFDEISVPAESKLEKELREIVQN